MENIALFNSDSVNSAIAEYPPAQVIVVGLTVTEKKLSVVKQASVAAAMYLSGNKGKVGKAAREHVASMGEAAIAKHCRSGNYKPLADAIAALLGASLTISNRGSYETLADRFADQLRDLKNDGFIACKKTNTMKPSAKRNTLVQVINLVTEVQSIAASL
jgi:hypothetical protein